MKTAFINIIHTIFRRLAATATILAVGFLLAGSTTAQAAYTDNFDDLLAELQARSVVLSNSTDKVLLKQKKACDKAIKTILKPADSLGDDVKTAGKLAKDLAKAFPSEFITLLNIKTVSTNLSDLIADLAAGIQSDISNALVTLQSDVNGLPSGNAKTKAQAAVAQAQAALMLAATAPDYGVLYSALSAATKAIANGQKAVASSTSGGGGGQGLTATITINGVVDNWVANQYIGAEWVQSSSVLDIGGDRSSGGGSHLSVAMCSGFNGQTGTYPLQSSCGGYYTISPFDFYAVQSGTLNVTTFNTSTHTMIGTFSISATNGVNTATITGSFNLNNLTVSP